MKLRQLAVYLAALRFASTGLSQEAATPPTTPMVIEHSRSPDGRKELTIQDTTKDDSSASGVVRVREVATGKSRGFFAWGSGYLSHPGPDSIHVLWRPDARAFAIESLVTKGYAECKVYTLSADGSCREVALPDFVSQVSRKYGYSSDFHGGEHPDHWLADHRLVISANNRHWSHELTPGGYESETYFVTLRFRTRAGRTEAIVARIRPATQPSPE